MPFLDEVTAWTDPDETALALGRSLGMFAPETRLADVKAVFWTNNPVGQTLFGLLQRLASLGVLEFDEEQERYRAGQPNLHALGAPDDVPALAGPVPASARVAFATADEGCCLEANRAGYRYLSQVFEQIADSSLEPGWCTQRDAVFAATTSAPAITLRLADDDE